ncbi:hypothetical protein EON63_21905 [archaeon]|nr:MAG: hypothetical protein EON63_21905 [archaeon]
MYNQDHVYECVCVGMYDSVNAMRTHVYVMYIRVYVYVFVGCVLWYYGNDINSFVLHTYTPNYRTLDIMAVGDAYVYVYMNVYMYVYTCMCHTEYM